MKLSPEQREKWFAISLALGIYTLLYPFIFYIGMDPKAVCEGTYSCASGLTTKHAGLSLFKFFSARQLLVASFFIFFSVGVKQEWDEAGAESWWWWVVLIILFIVFILLSFPALLWPKKD